MGDLNQNTIWTKVRSFILNFFIVFFLGFFYYSYILIPQHSKSYYTAEKVFLKNKKQNTIALNKLKEKQIGTEVYKEYKKAQKILIPSYNSLNRVKKEEKFFGFKSSHFFMERFGSNTFNFLFGCWVIVMFLLRIKPKSWHYIFIGLFLSTKIFNYLWIFQKFQDFSRITYHLIILFLTSLAIGLVYLYSKYKVNAINSLKRKLLRITNFTIFNTKDEKKEEMIKILNDIAKK